MTTNFNVKCINFMCSCIPTQLLVSCAVLKMLLLLLLFCFGDDLKQHTLLHLCW